MKTLLSVIETNWSIYKYCHSWLYYCSNVFFLVLQAWDDVERKAKPSDKMIEYSKRVVVDQEKSKIGLSEIYEQQFLKQSEVTNCSFVFYRIISGHCVILNKKCKCASIYYVYIILS